jgi:ATP-binding cassette, subfamily C (CFTR/MRP), member 4
MDHKEQQNWAESPHKKASRLSKMTFWWVRDLYRKGFKQSITEEDIYKTNKDHESGLIAEKFTKLWNEELLTKNPSTIRMFYRAYGLSLLSIGLLFSICESLIRCSQPLFLGALLSYFADPEGSRYDAYFYGTAIIMTSVVPVMTYHPFSYYATETAMKVKIGSSRLVYDKVSYIDTSNYASSKIIKMY